MKKVYKILVGIWCVEWIGILILKERGMQIDSLIGILFGIVLFFAPLEIFIWLLSNDENFSIKCRSISKVAFVWIFICCVGGIIVKILGMNN